MITPEYIKASIMMKFSGLHPMVERANKFENGCIEVHGYSDLTFVVVSF